MFRKILWNSIYEFTLTWLTNTSFFQLLRFEVIIYQQEQNKGSPQQTIHLTVTNQSSISETIFPQKVWLNLTFSYCRCQLCCNAMSSAPIFDDQIWVGMSEEQQIEVLRASVLGTKSLINDMNQKLKAAGLQEAELSLPDPMSNAYVFQSLPRGDQLQCLRASMQNISKKFSQIMDVICALPTIEKQRTDAVRTPSAPSVSDGDSATLPSDSPVSDRKRQRQSKDWHCVCKHQGSKATCVLQFCIFITRHLSLLFILFYVFGPSSFCPLIPMIDFTKPWALNLYSFDSRL